MFSSVAFASAIQRAADIAYGQDTQQTFDVYYPADAQQAPVIFMVHGGAWKMGDKASKAVYDNKVERWVTRGFVLISVNYRLLPHADPVSQARDVMRALRYAQRHAARWDADATKFILMGHSSGAHLVSLLATRPAFAMGGLVRKDNPKTPWLGTIALDSAGYDVVSIMSQKGVRRFYQKAFGDKSAYLQQASPLFQLQESITPFLAVCSEKRKDAPCQQAQMFVQKAQSLGTRAELLKVDLSHRAINVELGKANRYTAAVEIFMASLDVSVAALLRQ
ncbi:alpha/beta hydrolase [Amphritea opalescens]|uniref:alpha/beta hydrolase n=1 Tax=Amphritea opalescens TaxID=2490544 RepID=UPI0019D094A8|nr:alpha/beta hydrolase [Amphritea opalescens]